MKDSPSVLLSDSLDTLVFLSAVARLLVVSTGFLAGTATTDPVVVFLFAVLAGGGFEAFSLLVTLSVFFPS